MRSLKLAAAAFVEVRRFRNQSPRSSTTDREGYHPSKKGVNRACLRTRSPKDLAVSPHISGDKRWRPSPGQEAGIDGNEAIALAPQNV